MAFKQAILVRTDLKMGKGKIASQVAHASLASFLKVKKAFPEISESWLNEGMKKVVLKVSSENEIFIYAEKAKNEGVIFEIVRDAGHTQIPPSSITCLAIGPDKDEKIDKIVGNLKLL